VNFTTYADVFCPTAKRSALIYQVSLVMGGSLILALSAQLSFRLPLNPVPFTAQTLAVTVLGALLGSRRGLACVLLYLMEGACGLPVFASGGAGIGYMMGPTGGYLLGFAAGAWLTGWLAERGWDKHTGWAIAAMAVGHAVILICGTVWLSAILGLGNAIQMGLYPFLPSTVLKLCIGGVMLPAGWKLLKHLKGPLN